MQLPACLHPVESSRASSRIIVCIKSHHQRAEKAAEARKKDDAAKAAAAEREARAQNDALLRRREAIASVHPPVARNWPSALYTFDYIDRSSAMQEQRQYQFALHSSLPDMLMRERTRMLTRTRETMSRNIAEELDALSSGTTTNGKPRGVRSRVARTRLLISQRKLKLLHVQVVTIHADLQPLLLAAGVPCFCSCCDALLTTTCSGDFRQLRFTLCALD